MSRRWLAHRGRRVAAGVMSVAAVGVLVAAVGATARTATADAAAHLARGHGVAHDARAIASLARWLALGQPFGRASDVAERPVPDALPRRRVPAGPAASTSHQEVDRVVTVTTTGSNLSFEPARLSLKAGTRVRLDYVNDGVLPHNFVVLTREADLDALGAAAYEAEATGYVPTDQAEQLVAYTALAAPGTTVSVTFAVPAPGTYTFVCLFPGHYNVMLGTLRALS